MVMTGTYEQSSLHHVFCDTKRQFIACLCFCNQREEPYLGGHGDIGPDAGEGLVQVHRGGRDHHLSALGDLALVQHRHQVLPQQTSDKPEQSNTNRSTRYPPL